MCYGIYNTIKEIGTLKLFIENYEKPRSKGPLSRQAFFVDSEAYNFLNRLDRINAHTYIKTRRGHGKYIKYFIFFVTFRKDPH